MTLGPVSLPQAFAVWRRNATMYRRTWTLNLLPNFFEPVLYLLSMGIGVGSYVSGMGGGSYVAFIAPALVAVAAMNGASFEVAYNVFVRMHFEKQYDAMLTTPVQPEDVLVGEIAWAVTRSCIYGGAFFVVTMLFGLAKPPHALAALFVLPLTGLLFASIGMRFTLAIDSIELYSWFFTLFLTPIFLFSDVFFPLHDRLHGPWIVVAELLPLLHPVRLVRGAFAGELRLVHLWDVAYVVVLSALLLRGAMAAMRRRLSG